MYEAHAGVVTEGMIVFEAFGCVCFTVSDMYSRSLMCACGSTCFVSKVQDVLLTGITDRSLFPSV